MTNPAQMSEDEILELIVKRDEGTITKQEKSLLNKAEWANRHGVKKELEPARSPIGTPLGNKQRIDEYKKRLLAAPVAETMIRKMIEIAQNDNHPGQMAALKMAIDRILPASAFEEKKGGGRTAITISISGIGDNPTVIENDAGDITDV
jgi:hypothetical protein